MQAIILSIGDELVLGQTVDTNSAYLSQRLAERGISTRYHQTVADDQAAIADVITHASRMVPLILITGGLGPTEDDLTRQAMSDAMAAPLVLDEQQLATIKTMMTRDGRRMPDRNRIQAMHPRGTDMISNTCGTAPGIFAKLNKASIYVMPGVPHEMLAMFARDVEPELDAFNPDRHVILTAKVNTFGQGESSIAESLGDLMARSRNPKVGTTAGQGIVAVRVRSEFADAGEAQLSLDDTMGQVRDRLGAIVFGVEDETLQQTLVNLLRDKGATVATAESCTGGLVGKMISDIPGSSSVYAGGWVTYSNQMKHDQLGVRMELIDEHGAVSEPVARAMARGALEHSGATLATSITGVAGPTGGSEEKPVGTVWIAVAEQRAAADPEVQTMLFQLPGDRDTVRDRAARCALQMLRFMLLDQSLDDMAWGKRGT